MSGTSVPMWCLSGFEFFAYAVTMHRGSVLWTVSVFTRRHLSTSSSSAWSFQLSIATASHSLWSVHTSWMPHMTSVLKRCRHLLFVSVSLNVFSILARGLKTIMTCSYKPQSRIVTGPKTLVKWSFSGTSWVSRHQKGKPFWILMKQEMIGGNGIRWTIMKNVLKIWTLVSYERDTLIL